MNYQEIDEFDINKLNIDKKKMPLYNLIETFEDNKLKKDVLIKIYEK